MFKGIFKSTVISFTALAVTAGAAQAMSSSSYSDYRSLAEDGIRKLSDPSFSDWESLRSVTNRVIEIGKKGAGEHAAENPGSAKLMNLLVSNVEKMKRMSIPEIEEAWHDGGVIEANGIDYDFSATGDPDVNHVEAVVHAVTVLLLIDAYEADKDRGSLEQARDEFAEVIENFPNS